MSDRVTGRATFLAAGIVGLVTAMPCFTQDADIVFMSRRDGNDEIYVMSADGSGQRNLTSDPSSDMAPSWSPDGQEIVFASDRDGSYDIYVMDVNGGGVQRLTTSPYIDMSPSWSPDGSTIVFCSDRSGVFSIFGISLNGGDAYQITDEAAHDISPAWSPDGTRIAFSSDRRLVSVGFTGIDGETVLGLVPLLGPWGLLHTSADIFVMDEDGTDLVNLGRHTGLNYSNFPTWSPEGRSIAFYSSDRTSSGEEGLFIVDADLRATRHVFAWANKISNPFNPSWSPDGEYFVFGSVGPTEGGLPAFGISLITADGKNATSIVARADFEEGDFDPEWSPMWIPGQVDLGTAVMQASWGQIKLRMVTPEAAE